MIILGINFFFEHTAVSIIKNGSLLFFSEEERFSGIKGGKRYSPYTLQMPYKSMYAALRYLDLKISDIDIIALSYDKWKHLHGLFSKRWSRYDDFYALRNLFHLKRFFCSEYEMLQYMSDRISISDLKKIPIVYFDHHLSHAASAFCYSGYDKSLVFVADCCGEKSCTSLYVGTQDGLTKIKSFNIPNSLGIFYSVVTKHLGFNTFQDEYKVMGLASYGEDSFREEFKHIITYDSNGHYTINSQNLFALSSFIGPARKENEPITQTHKNIAKTLQSILEDILIRLLTFYRNKTGINKLCMAGGVALNCVANGKIHDANLFDDIFVQPASGDAGTAIGAAALANFKYLGGNIQVNYDNMYLGTEYSNEYIEQLLKQAGLKYEYFSDNKLTRIIASKVAAGDIGGIFRGRMEAGPRALGNRSVIANPSVSDMLERINTIKGREMFRPIAPIVKEDKFDEYFDGIKNQYMLFTCVVKDEARTRIPAVTHVDNTSRVQTVTKRSNEFIYNILSELENFTGIPIIINTSLNFKGKPIVENPIDAIGNFYSSGLNFFVIGNFLLEK